MDTHIETYTCATSTTWEFRRVRVNRAPDASKHSRPKGGLWHLLPRRDRRQPLTIKVKYRGGAECWYEIHARGGVGRVPGHVALHDLMEIINSGNSPTRARGA